VSETLTVLRPGTQRRGGDVIYAEAGTVAGYLAPRGDSSENNDARNTVTVGLTLLLDDPTADVRPHDRLRYAGQLAAYHGTWDVQGEPGVWASGPFAGGPEGVEVALVRVAG
jgi:hypothetical protein